MHGEPGPVRNCCRLMFAHANTRAVPYSSICGKLIVRLVGFTSIRSANQPKAPPHKASKPRLPPLFLILRDHINPLYHKNYSRTHPLLEYTLQNSASRKCLIISATISTLLIIPILLTMCRITALWLTRSPKF